MPGLHRLVVVVILALATSALAAPKPPKLLRTLKGHTGRIDHAAISADNAHVVTLADDKTARLWDAAGSTVKTFGDAQKPARAAKFTPDGTLLAVIVGSDLELWDVKGNTSSRTIANVKPPARNYGFETIQMPMWISPDGAKIAIVDSSKLSVWSVATAKQLLAIPSTQYVLPESELFSPDSKRIVVAVSGEYRLYDLATGKPLKTFPRKDTTNTLRPAPWLSTRFGGNGQVLFSYNANGGDLYAWDTSTGKLLVGAQLTVTVGKKPAGGMDTYGQGAAFSPSGSHMLSFVGAGGGNLATVYDLVKGAKAFELAGKPSILDATYNSAGTRIAATTFNERLMIWDASNGKSMGQIAAHRELILTMEFSADGSRIVTGGNDKTAKVWDVSGS